MKFHFVFLSIFFALVIIILLLIQFNSTKDEVTAKFIAGLKALNESDYEKTKTLMTEVIDSEPNNYYAYYIRGKARYEMESPFISDVDWNDLKKAIELNPEFTPAKIVLSQVLIEFFSLKLQELGDPSEWMWQHTIANEEGRVDSKYQEIDVQNYLKRDETLNELNRILKLNENNHQALYYRGLSKYFRAKEEFKNKEFSLLESRKITDINDFNRAIELSNLIENVSYIQARAVSNFDLHKDYTNACDDFRHIDSLPVIRAGFVYHFVMKPHEISFRIGQCYFQMNKLEEAKLFFAEAKGNCPHKEYDALVEKIDSLMH